MEWDSTGHDGRGCDEMEWNGNRIKIGLNRMR